MKIYNQAIGILGIWLIITALFTDYLSFMIWSNTIVGLAISIAGFQMLELQKWAGIIALIIGIWLIHTFYFFEAGMPTTTMVVDNIICGVVLVGCGYLSQPAQTQTS